MKRIKTSCVAGAAALVCGLALAGEPAVRIETGAARAEVTALGWDTEGTGRERTNLLRPRTMVGLRIRCRSALRLNSKAANTTKTTTPALSFQSLSSSTS
jgi:hypothetical protein